MQSLWLFKVTGGNARLSGLFKKEPTQMDMLL